VRSADKPVSPLSWFTALSCAEVAAHLERHFAQEFHVRQSQVSAAELDAAHRLVATKYSTPAWVNRLP
jgi:lipoate-protein ligase A